MSSLSEFTSVVSHVQIWVNSVEKYSEKYTLWGVVREWVARGGKKVPGSSPGWARMPFCVEFACSPHVCGGFLRVLRFPPQSKDMLYRWIGQRTLAVVSECVCEWVSECVLALGWHELVHTQGWAATGRASGVKTCQIGCVDHSAVVTPDKGSKPKKESVVRENAPKL